MGTASGQSGGLTIYVWVYSGRLVPGCPGSGVGANGTSALSRIVAEQDLATSFTAFNLAYKVRRTTHDHVYSACLLRKSSSRCRASRMPSPPPTIFTLKRGVSASRYDEIEAPSNKWYFIVLTHRPHT